MRQRFIFFLLAINFLLWALLAYLLTQHPLDHQDQHGNIILQQAILARKDNAALEEEEAAAAAAATTAAKVPSHPPAEQILQDETTLFDGVAATLMLKSPKWFQRRYTVMVHNVLSSIPPTWAVQIFVAPHPQAKEGITSGNVGLQRLIESNHPRVFLTQIPDDIWNNKQKPKLLLTDRWIWEQMKAENVFLFSGNGAICANSHVVLQNFTSLDYVGIPWWRHDRMGGDGSTHSFRKKSAILDVLKYTSKADEGRGGKEYDGNEREDIFYVRTMIEMNKQKGLSNFQLASSEQTEYFGGTSTLQSTFANIDDAKLIDKYKAEKIGPPLVLSGTLPNLSNTVRETVLELCPEIKVIFPALHDPHCFGAKPDGEKCAESICALRDPTTRKGGC